MDKIAVYNVLDLLIGIGIVAFSLGWFIRNKHQRWVMLPLLVAGLFVVGFESALMYRYATWESCPPVCGLQVWSQAVRLTLASVILIMSGITGAIRLWRIEWNGTTHYS